MESVGDRLHAVLEEGFTWAFDNYSPFVVVTFGTYFLHELYYFGSYLPYVIADRIPYLQKYKIQQDKQNTFDLQWNCFLRILYLHTLWELPMMSLSHHILAWLGVSTTPPFPSWSTILGQCILFFFIEDFYFYWIHRLLHYGPFYKYVHKVHHEHAAPFGIAAEYAHPIETIFLGLGSVMGPFLLRAHLLTLWVWLLFRVWQTVDVHSGYDFPFSPNRFIPFWGGAEFHDYHHMAFVGNYSSTFTIWDRVFGTDAKYHSWKAKQKAKQS